LLNAYGKITTVKALDIFCGIVSVFLDKDPTSPARRDLYGKAGSHRPKNYGVEYRAMSPWWLASPRHSELVYELAAAAMVLVKDDGLVEEKPFLGAKLGALVASMGGEDELQRIINDADVAAARKVYNELLVPYLDRTTTRKIKLIDSLGSTDFQAAWKLV
jgi:hypothetical protein